MDNPTLDGTTANVEAFQGMPSLRKYHRVERSDGAFERSVRRSAAVDASKVMATFKSGPLAVTLPKAPGAKGTSIPVKAG